MKYNFSNICIQLALALSAASALMYEVVATNILFFYFVRSSYSIATVLSVFLLGLGIGSLLVYFLLPKIKNKWLLFGSLQVAIALYAFFVLTNIADIVPSISTLGTFATSFLILLVPTVFLGAIFPLAGSLYKRDKKEIIGLIYSVDLFGAIFGTLFAGFLLIPVFGSRATVGIAAVLNLTSAFLIFPKKNKIISGLAFILFLIPMLLSPSIVFGSTSEYQFYANSPYGEVYVQNDVLVIDGRYQCSICDPEDAYTRVMSDYALQPLVDVYSNLDVLNIGLGCGITIENIVKYPRTEVDVVEINYQVILANKMLTNVMTHPRVNLIIDDGLNYLRYSDKKYHSILLDLDDPTLIHASNLYTVEAFNLVFDHLVDNGTFTLWNFHGNNRFLRILFYSLKESFPYVYSIDEVFLASKQQLDRDEYIPFGPWEINTIDKNTLTDAFLNG